MNYSFWDINVEIWQIKQKSQLSPYQLFFIFIRCVVLIIEKLIYYRMFAFLAKWSSYRDQSGWSYISYSLTQRFVFL